MVYPDTAVPVVIEIAPGAAPAGDPADWTWVDITECWRIANGGKITIDQGRSDWGSKVDHGTCTLTLDNRSGDFSEHNPLGQWYGQLGKNTPLRVRLRRVEDAFARTVSDGWGTATSGQAWTTSGGSTSDYSVADDTGQHSVGSTNVSRCTVTAAPTDVEVLVRVSIPVTPAGAAIDAAVVLRWQDDANHYLARARVNTDGSVQAGLLRNFGGTLSTIDEATVDGLTHAPATPLWIRARVDGDDLAVRVWQDGTDEPTGWHVSDTDTTYPTGTAVGVRSIRNAGNSNGTVVLAYDAYAVFADLFGGFVPAWDPRWDKTGRDRTVPITAYGVIYRLQPGQAKPPERSPLRRSIASPEHEGLIAYWPCEDREDSTRAASALPGQPAMTSYGEPLFGVVETVFHGPTAFRYGSSKVVDLGLGGRLVANIPAGSTSPVEWTVQFGAGYEVSDGGETVVLAEWTTPGAVYGRWRIVLNHPALTTTLVVYDGSGSATTLFTNAGFFGSFSEYRVDARQNGSDVDIRLWLAGDLRGSTSVAGTLTWPATVAANPDQAEVSVELAFGHLQVWQTYTAPRFGLQNGDDYPAWFSYTRRDGEAATTRLGRLCREDNIPFYAPTIDAADEGRMGIQLPGTPLALYRQCEDADGGILYERPFSLALKPRATLYNQEPALVLDAQGDLAEAPEPDSGDQQYRNRWELRRTGGSSAVAEAPEVAEGALVYDESEELTLIDDTVLADVAGWRLHLSTHRAVRWPRLQLDLAARPELLDAWLNCRIGSRIIASNPMQDVAGEDIDVLLQGYSLTIGHKDFDIVANCTPAAPWQVATVDGDQLVPADGSTLASTLAEGAMTLSLASTAPNGLWTTDTEDFPLDVRVGGERITLSGISSASSPQTATISARGVNGITRAWPAGTPVDVWAPAITAH